MKTVIALFFCAVGALVAYAESPAERAAVLMLSADTVKILEDDGNKQPIVFQDPDWIQRVSKAVAAAPISESMSCFCVGWRSFGFYKNDELVISIAPIHGNQLRIYEAKGDHGDFPVTEASWNAVDEALKSLHKPNTALVPAPIAITPAADAAVAPSTAAARLNVPQKP